MFCVVAVAMVLAGSPGEAQRVSDVPSTLTEPTAAALRTTRAFRLTGTIRVDGHLDEAAWQHVPAASDFTQAWPQPGAPATKRTEFRVIFDDEALYVGVRMLDSDVANIAAPLARRDATNIYSDWVHLMVDSFHDRRNAFRFSVNPRGVQKDVLHSDDNVEDLFWDAVWQVATSIDDKGWTAEYRIPFTQLRFGPAAPGSERTWGIQIQRDIAHINERDTWAPWSMAAGGFVRFFGDVAGVGDVPPTRRLEAAPYVSDRIDRLPGTAANPFYHATGSHPSVGADVKLGVSRGLTLTATVNPDFGQVEVDPAVVNLSAFEISFPEKRPFFTEGANVFAFGRLRVGPTFNGQQFFYTRRIGRPPQRSVSGAQYVDTPDETTILGAAKLSGKSGPWTVGVLDALTDKETADFQSPGGALGTTAVEPRSNYLIGRVQRDFRRGATVIGALVTSANRDLGDTVFRDLLRTRAQAGGVDFDHRWGGGNWSLTGYAVGSTIGGSAGVIAGAQRSSSRYYQRPDARQITLDPTRTSLGGHMAEVAFQKTGRLYLSLDAKDASPGFEVNDLGFQGRVDYRSVADRIGYNSFKAGAHLRTWSANAGTNNAWNYDGDRIWNSVFGSAIGTLNNFWAFNVFWEYDPGVVSDRLTRGGPLGFSPTTWAVFASVASDARRRVFSSLNLSRAGDREGSIRNTVTGTVELRPSTSVRITIGPTITVNNAATQYYTSLTDAAAASTLGKRYVFAALDQHTVSADTRVDWILTPTLSFQLYAQPFISIGDYHGFKSLRTPRTNVYDPYAVTANPDFNVRSLRGNAVVRWEYRPGSAIYAVWQQMRSGAGPAGDYEFGRDWRGIFETRPANVFLIKASYWIAS
jgi:hypothetical protein